MMAKGTTGRTADLDSLRRLSAPDRKKAEALWATLDERPGDLRARRSLGDLYRAAGEIDEAVSQYQALVGAFAAQGLLFRAIAACKLVLELRPDDDDAARALADLYARRTAGKESAELPAALGAALTPPEDGRGEGQVGDGSAVLEADAAGIMVVAVAAPPLPPPDDEPEHEHDEGDADVVDLDALAGAMTPLPEGGVLVERPPAVPLFSGLSTSSFRELLRELRAWEAEPAAVIVGEGEESDSVYVVVRGKVRVERGRDGEATVLAHLGPDSFFGEMALVSRRPRAASVIAEERTELLEIPREVFDRLAARDASVHQALEGFARTRLLENLGRTSPLFQGLPDDVLRDTLASFHGERVGAGAVVVERGTAGRGLFVILQGECDVVGRSELGEVRLKRLGPGDVFGEMSLVSGEPTSASVVAASDVALLSLSPAELSSFAASRPALAERLAHIAATRRAFNERFLPDATSSASLV